MSAADDGGGAFPSGVAQDGYNPGQEPWQRGLSVRDYFAAKALQAHIGSVGTSVVPEKREDAARRAYQYADAMMKERSQ